VITTAGSTHSADGASPSRALLDIPL
jgi:hypothetical protein